MIPLQAFRHAASSLLGEGAAMGPSVALGQEPLDGIAADTTALAGADVVAATRPEVARWLEQMASWLSGAALDLHAPVRLGSTSVWPLLSHGEGPFDPSPLHGAIPVGGAWICALTPHRFFVQAADHLELHGGERGTRLAGRLRARSGNIALVGDLVETVALSLDPEPRHATIRLRVRCPDPGAARQTLLLLQGWRMRRAMRDTPDAVAFADARAGRVGTRVEIAVRGDLETVLGIFARG